MRKNRGFAAILPLLLLALGLGASVLLVGQRTRTPSRADIKAEVKDGDLRADVIIGKRSLGEISPREVVDYKLSAPGGIIVDRSVSPAGRLYVWDSGNSRILGVNLAECYSGPSPCKASIVLGQPAGNDYGACNQDASFSTYPKRQGATKNSLCGMPEWTHTTLEDKSFISMFVDARGDLYVPDSFNHRVLKFKRGGLEASEVWGQPDFTSNKCNLTTDYNQPVVPPTAASLCFHSPWGSGSGTALDKDNNLWVADGGNHRILRFPNKLGAIAKTADLVLGQPSFTSGNPGLLNSPAAVLFDSAGKLYVADTGNKRVAVFTPPFSPGSGGQALIAGLNHPTGLTLDPQGRGLWIMDLGKIYLYDFSGKLLESTSLPSDSGGSLDFDPQGNLLVSAYGYSQDVFRFTISTISRDACAAQDGDVAACDKTPGCAYYFCSNQCWLRGTPNEVACKTSSGLKLTKKLFSPPEGYNLTSNRRLEHPAWVGVVATRSQLIVSDGRLLFWNDPQHLITGSAADGLIQGSFGQIKIDASSRLWVGRKDHVEVYQTPLTSNSAPLKTIGPTLSVLGGGQITLGAAGDIHGLVPTPQGDFLWISEPARHRVLRLRQPFTNPIVDIILGQKSPDASSCNRGEIPAPNTNPGRPAGADAKLDMLCFPGALSMDRKNNLYVSDHTIEAEGNWRLLMFSPQTFPSNPPTLLYAPQATKEFPRRTDTNPQAHATFEVAFDSTNRMVAGYNPYLGDRFVDVYNNPTAINPKNPSDPNFAKPDSRLVEFTNWPVAITFDPYDNLFVYDANRGQVRLYQKPFPKNQPLSCRMLVYNASDTTKPPYKYGQALSGGATLLPYRYYLYGLEVKNLSSNKTLGGLGVTITEKSGSKETLNIINADPNCSVDKVNKTVKCGVPNSLGPSGSALVSAGHVVQIQPPDPNNPKVTTIYNLTSDLGSTSCAFAYKVAPVPGTAPGTTPGNTSP